MSDAQQRLTQLSHPRRPPHAPQCGGESGAPFATDALDRTVGVDILLLPGFDLLDLATAEEIANIINRTSRRYRFEIAVRSVCDGPARASCGVEMAAISRRAPAQNLLVLGGAVQAPNQYAPWQFRLRRVSSIIVPVSLNLMLNPAHPLIGKVTALKFHPFAFDTRLLRKNET